MWGLFFWGFFFFCIRFSKSLRINKMSYFNSESNDLLIDQDTRIKEENKPDLILKMGLAELILHAAILILLV